MKIFCQTSVNDMTLILEICLTLDDYLIDECHTL